VKFEGAAFGALISMMPHANKPLGRETSMGSTGRLAFEKEIEHYSLAQT
jgi:hypothetical protein